MSGKILVVDDEPGVRKSLAIMLRREGYDVAEAADAAGALEHLGREVFDLVITDLRMGEVSGIDLLRAIGQTSPTVPTIVVTAFGTVESAVEAMKLGAFDFVTKPFRPEEILIRARNALESRRLREEVQQLRTEAKVAFGLDGIVAVSDSMREVLAKLPRIAQTQGTVLVTGESGTGKELVARAVHLASRRAHGPFVSVSCASVPESLLENELFGHVKGAFTGALAARKGLIEEAHGGTFFLDEVGETPASIQAKLLRILEDRTLRRLGDNRSIPVDVRIVAATNRDLEAAIRDKVFREDLFYRLNVFRIHLPPLRERREDIPVLARHFSVMHAQRLGRDCTGFSPEAIQALCLYDFPGNVRELSNMVEQAVALAAESQVELVDLPDAVHPAGPPRFAPETAPASPEEPAKTLAELERGLIIDRIKARSGNLNLVAADLGISRTTLWRRMREYEIELGRWGFAR
jgi:DNA-binding NtrC family response regulator